VDAECLLDICLATAQYTIQFTIHQTLKTLPGALVFQRGIILPIQLNHDLEAI
jgi:hypothetical protein